MPKQNRKPGIHLHVTKARRILTATTPDYKPAEYHWILIAKNGKTIAKSSEMYRTKRAAVRSIRIAANIFYQAEGAIGFNFLDHSTGKAVNDFVPF